MLQQGFLALILIGTSKMLLQTFVPRTVAPVDSILPLSKHFSFIKTFDNRPIDTTGFSAFDYTVIIHWSKKWRLKDSKNLIKIVSDNANLAVNKK